MQAQRPMRDEYANIIYFAKHTQFTKIPLYYGGNHPDIHVHVYMTYMYIVCTIHTMWLLFGVGNSTVRSYHISLLMVMQYLYMSKQNACNEHL